MIVALVLCLLSTASALERRYALVIGNNTGTATELPLRYAEADAQRVADVLTRFGDFSPGNVAVLKDHDATEILAELRRLEQRIEAEAAAADQTMLFVYYSGHADQNALHPGDSLLPLSALHDAVDGSAADLRLLVVDACRSGALLRMKGGAIIEPFEISFDAGGTAILTSAAENEDAQESDRLRGGVFTHHFTAGLQGAADTSGDAQVSLTEIFDYTSARTRKTTTTAPVMQHPSYDFDIQGAADLILTAIRTGPRVGQLQLSAPGLYVISTTAGALIHEVEVAAGSQVALPAGRYTVLYRRADRADEAEVTVRSREVTAVSPAQMTRLPMGQVARRGTTSERHQALALIGGGGVLGAAGTLQPTGYASSGARLELPWLTVVLRGRYGRSSTTNDFLTTHQTTLGAQLGVLRMWDVRRLSLGAGVMGGADRVHQHFDTTGTAPSLSALTANAAAIGRAELAVAPRWTIGVELAPESTLRPDEGDTLAYNFLPRIGLEVALWLR